MLHFRRRISALFGLVTGLYLVLHPVPSVARECDKELTILVSAKFPPFSVQKAGGIFQGIDIDIITNVMNRAECPFRFVDLPWKRGLQMLADGDIDMMAFASITPEREEFARFSRPYRYERIRLIMDRDDIKITNIARLDDIISQGLVIGNSTGTWRGQAFAGFVERHKLTGQIVDVPSTTHGIRMINIGRINALVAEASAARAIAENFDLQDKLDAHPFPILDDPVHLMASRKSVPAHIMKRINAAIATIPGPTASN